MPDPVIDPSARRDPLATQSNPDQRLDYVVSLEGRFMTAGAAGPTAVGLRYVPDKLILERDAFGRYLDVLAGLDWPSLEALAVAVRDDVNNEVVARWVQVTVSAPIDAGGVAVHDVMLEDRQPGWDNRGLLSRLKRA